MSEASRIDQAKYWKRTGEAWTELHPALDRLHAPVERAQLSPASPGVGERVHAVGGGAGATTLAADRRVGAHGSCVDIDISAAVLALAREGAEAEGLAAARFVEGEAQTGDFGARGDGGFAGALDVVLSRFGGMFFGDFDAAFANV